VSPFVGVITKSSSAVNTSNAVLSLLDQTNKIFLIFFLFFKNLNFKLLIIEINGVAPIPFLLNYYFNFAIKKINILYLLLSVKIIYIW